MKNEYVFIYIYIYIPFLQSYPLNTQYSLRFLGLFITDSGKPFPRISKLEVPNVFFLILPRSVHRQATYDKMLKEIPKVERGGQRLSTLGVAPRNSGK